MLKIRSKTPVSLLANRIINALPENERVYILKYGRSVELKSAATPCTADQPIKSVYFPTAGFISQTVSSDCTQGFDMGLIGSEGMLGVTLLLGEKKAPITAIVQGAGAAISMSSAQFNRALCQNPVLLRTLNRYLFDMLRQWSQVAFCAHYHQTDARLTRLLLMTHDRTRQTSFYFTQEVLAKMLGVRRSSVTMAASELQRLGLIQYDRGNIDILNRTGLKTISCSCYTPW